MTSDTDAQHDDEEVLLVLHKHWGSLVVEALGALAAGLMLLVLLYISQSGGFSIHFLFVLLVPTGLLFIWIIIFIFWGTHYLNMLIITDRRIFSAVQVSMASRMVREWNITDIKEVSVHIGNVLESFMKYGTLSLKIRGGEVADIAGIPDPEYVAAIILKQDDRYGQLKETARKQQEMLKFISHEVKGHLTKSKAAFASIVEGDYGPVSTSLGSLAQHALEDSQQGVQTVMSILDSSDFTRGSAHYEKKPFDFSATVQKCVDEFRGPALQKQLGFSVTIDKFCAVIGDEEKISRHVLRNLIDNAIHYTPAGHIKVTLTKGNGVARLSVADTGIGLASTDVKKLFTQGGHGERSKSVNPESTGYGLFIAKQIVEAHGGKIWAHSSGPGTGTTFFVELPIAK